MGTLSYCPGYVKSNDEYIIQKINIKNDLTDEINEQKDLETQKNNAKLDSSILFSKNNFSIITSKVNSMRNGIQLNKEKIIRILLIESNEKASYIFQENIEKNKTSTQIKNDDGSLEYQLKYYLPKNNYYTIEFLLYKYNAKNIYTLKKPFDFLFIIYESGIDRDYDNVLKIINNNNFVKIFVCNILKDISNFKNLFVLANKGDNYNEGHKIIVQKYCQDHQFFYYEITPKNSYSFLEIINKVIDIYEIVINAGQ